MPVARPARPRRSLRQLRRGVPRRARLVAQQRIARAGQVRLAGLWQYAGWHGAPTTFGRHTVSWISRRMCARASPCTTSSSDWSATSPTAHGRAITQGNTLPSGATARFAVPAVPAEAGEARRLPEELLFTPELPRRRRPVRRIGAQLHHEATGALGGVRIAVDRDDGGTGLHAGRNQPAKVPDRASVAAAHPGDRVVDGGIIRVDRRRAAGQAGDSPRRSIRCGVDLTFRQGGESCGSR
jgi:hypothetical protein